MEGEPPASPSILELSNANEEAHMRNRVDQLAVAAVLWGLYWLGKLVLRIDK